MNILIFTFLERR